MNFSEYLQFDATALAGLIRDRKLSAHEVTAAAVARKQEINPRNSAVIRHYDETAMSQASDASLVGPFCGVPFLLKDMPDGALGEKPLTCGSSAVSGYIAKRDSELVARYRLAGLILLGSTNSPELGLMGTTEPKIFRPARNP